MIGNNVPLTKLMTNDIRVICDQISNIEKSSLYSILLKNGKDLRCIKWIGSIVIEVGVCVYAVLTVCGVPGVIGGKDDGVFFQYVKLVRVIEPSIISMVLSTIINMTRLLIVLDSRSLPISPGMLDVLII